MYIALAKALLCSNYYIYSYEEKLQLKFEIHKIIMVNYMFLICCSQFRASSVSRWSLEKPCWNLVITNSIKSENETFKHV
jgi:hypothetical protein